MFTMTGASVAAMVFETDGAMLAKQRDKSGAVVAR
jgi:hypothetical protein